MSVYKLLFDEALRITGSLDQAAAIASAVIQEGISVALESGDAEKGQTFMVSRVINKSLDYVRLRDNEDFTKAANELNEPIGMIRQIMRDIKQGKYY